MTRRLRISHRLFGVGALIVFIVLFPLAGRSTAQEQAGIIGQVTDESGAVLPDERSSRAHPHQPERLPGLDEPGPGCPDPDRYGRRL